MNSEHNHAAPTVMALRIASLCAAIFSILESFLEGPTHGIPAAVLTIALMLMSIATLPLSIRGARAVNIMRCFTALDAIATCIATTADPDIALTGTPYAGLAMCLASWAMVQAIWTGRDSDALKKHAYDGLTQAMADDMADIHGLDDSDEWIETCRKEWDRGDDSRANCGTVTGSQPTGPVPTLEHIRRICLALPDVRRVEIDHAIERCRRLTDIHASDSDALEGMKSIRALDEVVFAYERAARIADEGEIAPLAEQVGEAVMSAARTADADRLSLLRSASKDLQTQTRYLAYRAPGPLDEDV